MEVFMDDFSFVGATFDNCLEHLEKVLERCAENNLVLNLEKSQFMVKEWIFLVYKILGHKIKVDQAKVEVLSV